MRNVYHANDKAARTAPARCRAHGRRFNSPIYAPTAAIPKSNPALCKRRCAAPPFAAARVPSVSPQTAYICFFTAPVSSVTGIFYLFDIISIIAFSAFFTSLKSSPALTRIAPEPRIMICSKLSDVATRTRCFGARV